MHRLNGPIQGQNGFTVLEALVSLLIVGIVALSATRAITYFGLQTGQDMIGTCLVQAASSGIEAKRANHSTSNLKVACGGYTVTVSITGTPPATPPAAGSGRNACVEITSSASIGSRSMVLKDVACRFPP